MLGTVCSNITGKKPDFLFAGEDAGFNVEKRWE
jgi:hypothetical protein